MPPRRLRARTGAPGAREFADGGRIAAAELLSAGVPQPPPRTVLDFGCGSGRVLPHMAELIPGARLIGCDVDPAAITWAARHRPECDWLLSAADPPLPIEAGGVELLYSISVFSHLAEDRQDAWLAELHRVLAPGATALLSVHGAHAFEQFRTGRVQSGWCRSGAFARESLAPGEFVFEPYVRSRWNAADLPGVGERYGLAFHDAEYIRRRWSELFDVVEIRPRAITAWQDLVVVASRR